MLVLRNGRVIVFCTVVGTLGLIAWATGPQVARKRIHAGTIEWSPASNSNTLQGSFKISSSPSSNAIPSNGTGGACLIADLNRFGFPQMPPDQNGRCTKNSDCAMGLPARWSGYCDVEREKTCWVRPGPDNEDLCNKSPFQPWEEGVDHPVGKIPFDLSKLRYPELTPSKSFSTTYPGQVRWRVVACLNGKDLIPDAESGQLLPPCAAKGATDQQRMLVFGPPKTVPSN